MSAPKANSEGGILSPTNSKAVLIAEPESISPGPSPRLDNRQSAELPTSPKKHRASISLKKLSGRRSINRSTISPQPLAGLDISPGTVSADTQALQAEPSHHRHQHRAHHRADHVISQVRDWLQHEKARAAKRKSKLGIIDTKSAIAHGLANPILGTVDHDRSNDHTRHRRRSSDISDEGLSLEKLEEILSSSLQIDDDTDALVGSRKTSLLPRKGSIRKLARKKSTLQSSDTECHEGDIRVPSAEVTLDNSKTLSYSGGAAASQSDLISSSKRAKKEKEAWIQFKNEIVRLAHTLRLKGWRRIPLDRGAEIDVERLCGALTNAVYVVSPPQNLPETPVLGVPDGTSALRLKKPPAKLLLRIYGPQVEHLIDRENELQILRRLARKKIGPRMLGTFSNGRFEEFFNARTLTAEDLRIPETSKQIAKRMRELHEGIELLDRERDAGPFIWQNWDKWVERCREVISWIDGQILSHKQGAITCGGDAWKKRGLVCGVEWAVFHQTVERYRKWLEVQFGGPQAIRDRLVFAHNDTQYGNLLRLQPSGESPLLHPANEHKQLIVIDFEYASANTPGLEFANHFSEWCYDYTHVARPYALNEHWYPTREEQRRFIKAYVQHHPFRPSLSTNLSQSSVCGPSSSVSSFMLDSRAPPAQIAEDEKLREEAMEAEVQRLMHEARIWRVANSAQWVAWGIVQAKVPGMDEALDAQKRNTTGGGGGKAGEEPESTTTLESDPLAPGMEEVAEDAQDKRPEEGGEGEEEEEFDYLGYAQERAMFFWGDAVQLGLVRREDLPEELVQKLKVIEY